MLVEGERKDCFRPLKSIKKGGVAAHQQRRWLCRLYRRHAAECWRGGCLGVRDGGSGRDGEDIYGSGGAGKGCGSGREGVGGGGGGGVGVHS